MSGLTGALALARLALRRDRLSASLWIAVLGAMTVGTAARYAKLFSTEAARRTFAETLADNRTLVAFGGQIWSTDIGGLTAFKVGSVLYNLVGLMALLAVVSHTRGEEESGRHELVAAGAIGRHASLAAALGAGCGASLAAGAVCALGLVAFGLPAKGSVAFGLAIAAPGFFFSALAALAAQLAQTARAARGIAGAALGAGSVVRFAADGGQRPWLRWLSPEGWSHEVRAFGEDRFWVLAVPLAAAAICGAAAFVLSSRRDLGAGLLPARPGPASGRRLGSALALAWRLQRGPLLAWLGGFAVLGVLFGSLAGGMPELTRRTGPVVEEFFRRYSAGPSASLVDAYLWLVIMSLGYTLMIYSALAALRLRTEETSGTAELLLSTPVSRGRWVASHAVFALAGPAIVMVSCGAVIGLLHGGVARIVAGALVQLPAIWVLGGVAVFMFGVRPRLAVGVAWAAFVFINVFGEVLGPALGIDFWVANQVSPFHHLPPILAGAAFSARPLAALLGVTALLSGAGLWAFRRRDLPA